MKQQMIKLLATLSIIAVAAGCSAQTEKREHQGNRIAKSESRGEHARDTGGASEGEEAGTEYTLKQTYDNIRNGARLILSYDARSNSFKGTVENTTKKLLQKVRVEVHLSNGIELGPTTPVDLKPGKKTKVTLKASEKKFTSWGAHPEVGSEEHGGEGEGDEGREGAGEHGGKKRSERRGEHR